MGGPPNLSSMLAVSTVDLCKAWRDFSKRVWRRRSSPVTESDNAQ